MASKVSSGAEENGDGLVAERRRVRQLALVAQLERATILEQVTAGNAKKKALGQHLTTLRSGSSSRATS